MNRMQRTRPKNHPLERYHIAALIAVAVLLCAPLGEISAALAGEPYQLLRRAHSIERCCRTVDESSRAFRCREAYSLYRQAYDLTLNEQVRDEAFAGMRRSLILQDINHPPASAPPNRSSVEENLTPKRLNIPPADFAGPHRPKARGNAMSTRQIAGWSTLGAGAGALLIGGALIVTSSSLAVRLESLDKSKDSRTGIVTIEGISQARYYSLRDEQRRLATGAGIAMGLGVLAVGIGTYWLVDRHAWPFRAGNPAKERGSLGLFQGGDMVRLALPGWGALHVAAPMIFDVP